VAGRRPAHRRGVLRLSSRPGASTGRARPLHRPRALRHPGTVTTSSLRWLLDPSGPVTADVFTAGPATPAAVLVAMAGEGLLVPVLPGVWLAADAAGRPAVRCRALARVVPPSGVVAGAAALWARGLHAGTGCPEVDVVVPPGAAGGSRTAADGVRLRGSVLAGDDVEVVAGLTLTTTARSLADLARWCPDGELAATAALSGALRSGCDAGLVRAALERSPRAPGVRRARRVLVAAMAGLPGPDASVLPLPRHPVDVEDAVHAAHRGEHVAQVGGVGHLERELGDRDAVAGRRHLRGQDADVAVGQDPRDVGEQA